MSYRHVAEHRRLTELLAADEREEAARLLSGHLEDALAALLLPVAPHAV